MEEISIRELFFILRKWMGMIMALLIVSVGASGAVSYYILNPEYQTFTTLMVGKPKDYQSDNSIEYNDIILNQKLVSTYGELVKSRAVTDNVIENLNLNLSYNTFRNKVNVNLVKDTEIIKLVVTDESPSLAVEIANETAIVFMEKVKEFLRVENIQVIDEAQLPERPIRPRPLLNMAIAGVLGVMVGVFISFFMEFLDNTIKTPDDIERHINLPILGAIPLADKKRSGLITMEDPKSPISESFRTLRTNIQFSSIDREVKVITVTSSGPSEGKSTVSANFAISLAQNGKKVLLMECDLRKPMMHKLFDISNSRGLTNILMGERDISALAHKCEGIDNLNIIFSGPLPPNPAELLGSNGMKKLVENLKEEYDMIILDSPPVGLVTDSAILSTITDGTLLVAAVGETDTNAMKGAKELLEKVQANLMGVILNKIPINNRSYYAYGYYQYYSYYGQD